MSMREQQHHVRGGHCSDRLLVKGEIKREEVTVPTWCKRLSSLFFLVSTFEEGETKMLM